MKVYYEIYNHTEQEINIFIVSESDWSWLKCPSAPNQTSTGSVKVKIHVDGILL